MKTATVITSFICLFGIAGCGNSVSPAKMFVPNVSQIKSMSEWSSSLPGAPHSTVTPKSSTKEIREVLGWLRKSDKIQTAPKRIGKGGYPPGITLTLKNGEAFGITPATIQRVKPLNSATEIITKHKSGYVDYTSDTASNLTPTYRIYAPKLYQWLMSGWQKDSNLYPSSVILANLKIQPKSLKLTFRPGMFVNRTNPSAHISKESGSFGRKFTVVLHDTKAGKYTLNHVQSLNTNWATNLELKQQGTNLILTFRLKKATSSFQPLIEGENNLRYTFQ